MFKVWEPKFKPLDYVLYMGLEGKYFGLTLQVIAVDEKKRGYFMQHQNGDCAFYFGDNWRQATKEEIAAGHRIDANTGVTVITPKGASKVKGGMTAFVDMGDDSHIENHISPLCKSKDF